jgi:hypothetical protein
VLTISLAEPGRRPAVGPPEPVHDRDQAQKLRRIGMQITSGRQTGLGAERADVDLAQGKRLVRP